MSTAQIPVAEYRQGIYYLVLDGKTPYERGCQHGVALEFPIKKALRQFRLWVRNNVGLEEPEAMNYLIGDRDKVVSVETWQTAQPCWIFTRVRLRCTPTTLLEKIRQKPLR